MNKNTFIIAIAVIMLTTTNPLSLNAQTSYQKSVAKTPSIKRLYFDHRGWVGAVQGDKLVINDRTFSVLATATILAKDQKPLAGLSKLKKGDYIGFQLDAKRRIEAIYLLNPPQENK